MKTKDSETVMLVDDDPNILLNVGDSLRFHGYDIVSAESAEEAINRIYDVTPDLIILDMSMPGIGGMAFLKAVSAPGGGLQYPVLVFTAQPSSALFLASTGIEGFLPKTTEPDMLLREVDRIVQRHRPPPGRHPVPVM